MTLDDEADANSERAMKLADAFYLILEDEAVAVQAATIIMLAASFLESISKEERADALFRLQRDIAVFLAGNEQEHSQ